MQTCKPDQRRTMVAQLCWSSGQWPLEGRFPKRARRRLCLGYACVSLTHPPRNYRMGCDNGHHASCAKDYHFPVGRVVCGMKAGVGTEGPLDACPDDAAANVGTLWPSSTGCSPSKVSMTTWLDWTLITVTPLVVDPCASHCGAAPFIANRAAARCGVLDKPSSLTAGTGELAPNNGADRNLAMSRSWEATLYRIAVGAGSRA
jgi:hypothetical protein